MSRADPQLCLKDLARAPQFAAVALCAEDHRTTGFPVVPEVQMTTSMSLRSEVCSVGVMPAPASANWDLLGKAGLDEVPPQECVHQRVSTNLLKHL